MATKTKSSGSRTRDHDPFVLEEFGGWWQRGDDESAPSDHFILADNVQYSHSSVESRDGLVPYLINPLPAFETLRMYNYITQTGDTLIILTTGGFIYHITGPTGSAITPILHIAAMEDFGFVGINGRAYITPFKNYMNAQGEKYQLGIQNEFLYVYNGDGTPARKAAGLPPTGTALSAILGASTAPKVVTDIGFHLFAVVYETNSGFLTGLGPLDGAGNPLFSGVTFTGTNLITVSNIPKSSDSSVIRRHIVSTKAIPSYNGDQTGYQFFFIPDGTLKNGTTEPTTITGSFFDSELIEDASHLIDNFSEIPAGVNLNTYHSRLVMVGEFGTDETLLGLPVGVLDNRSIARVSAPGEPESISKVDGLIVAPLDGQPLTNVQEFRDVLYLFKHTRTFGYSDNNDVPASWQEHVLDQGFGASVHGIATVLDTGGVNIDFLLIVDWAGILMFNGTYAQPEMTWKIERFWKSLDRNNFENIQIVNDTINKKIWMTLPDPHQKSLIHGNYANGMNADSIRWARWIFDIVTNTVALIQTDRLIIGTSGT